MKLSNLFVEKHYPGSKKKTIKVRIALAVDPHGAWVAYGWGNSSDIDDDAHDQLQNESDMMLTALSNIDEGEARCYWITTEIEVPEAREIKASKVKAENN